jgi:very-short-patch-repair endonuclease
MDAVQALQRLGGVATLGELLGPTTRAQLATAVAAGRVLRPRHNRYCLADVAEARRRAVVAGGVLSHLSAAEHYEWKVKARSTRPCVTVPRSSRKPAGDLELHWADLSDKEVHRQVTGRARTVIDCARVYPLDVALSVADSALREGVIDRHDLEVAAARSPRTGRARALRVVDLASGKRANPFESCLAVLLWEVRGLEVVPQGYVPGVGWVDFLDRRLGVVVEAESLEHHWSVAGLRRDVLRYTGCARLGLVVVRFTWDEVMFRPAHVVEAMADVVAWRTMQAVGRHSLLA